jgi:hypothetical protein
VTDQPIIPGDPVPLHRVAKQLGKATHVLVDASRRGEFPHVVKVGAVWYVSHDAVLVWFGKQHAHGTVSPAQQDRIRQAGRDAGAQPRPRPQSRLRAGTASSS